MPVTRGRARLMESQEEDVEEEPTQQMQQTPEEQTSTEAEGDAVAVDLKDMAKQLTKTLKHLLTTHRQLEADATKIQAGMDELHRMQEERATKMAGRLKNASSTILMFGDTSQDARHGGPEDEGDEDDIH